jgi:hypothetical protein
LATAGAASCSREASRAVENPIAGRRRQPYQDLRTQTRSPKKVAAECGVGGGTVQRIRREMAEVSRPFDGASAAT